MSKELVGFTGGRCTNTEIYDVFTLNVDIPDEKFHLPEEKQKRVGILDLSPTSPPSAPRPASSPPTRDS